MNILDKIKKFGTTIAKRVKELTLSQSKKKVRELIKEKKKFVPKDLIPGNLIFTSYNAKDKEQVYDRTPLVLILRRGSKYTLGLNFHWVPMGMRITLIKSIISLNGKNIKKGLPLEFSYNQLKPMLKSLGYAPVIRLYINKRLGGAGVVLPPSRLMEVARLKTETFTGGRFTAEQMLAKARKRK